MIARLPQKLFLTTVAAALLILPVSAASAQLIRIFESPNGGVHVRVPFVYVETDGFGGAYVRAPFVESYTPPYGPAPGWIHPPMSGARFHVPPPPGEFAPAMAAPAASVSDLAWADWQQLRMTLHDSLLRLAQSSVIQSRSEPLNQISEVLADDEFNRDNDQPLAETAKTKLLSLRATLDSLVVELRPLQNDYNLQLVMESSRQLLQPPLVRQQRLLAESHRRLNNDLTRFNTGAQWQDHLQLPPLGPTSTAAIETAERSVLSRGEPAEATELTAEQLELPLKRYHKVRDDETFQVIAQLASFQRTHRLLIGLRDQLRGQSVEELPAPTNPTLDPPG